MNLQLRPGGFVALVNPVTLVEVDGQVGALFHQNELHKVEPGNEAEFALKTLPGRIVKARVDSIIWAHGGGQLQPTGQPDRSCRAAAESLLREVRCRRGSSVVPGCGSHGDAAIYTDQFAFLHVLRKVILRVGSYELPDSEAALTTMRADLAASLLMGTLLASCALKTPPTDEVRTRTLTNLTMPAQWTAAATLTGTAAGNWIATFDDAQLEALVAEAFAHNNDVRLAAANVAALRARSRLQAQRSGPSWISSPAAEANLVETAPACRACCSPRRGNSMSGAAFDTGRPPPLPSTRRRGRFRIRTAVARGIRGPQLVSRDRSATADRALSERGGRRRRLISLAGDRERVGSGDSYEVAVASANLEIYRDALLQANLAYAQAVRALETLLGRYPAAALEVPPSLPALSAVPPRAFPRSCWNGVPTSRRPSAASRLRSTASKNRRWRCCRCALTAV